MNIGPTGWDRKSRDLAVRIWLDDSTRQLKRGKLWGRWLVAVLLRDVYERGYNHGYIDRGEDDA